VELGATLDEGHLCFGNDDSFDAHRDGRKEGPAYRTRREPDGIMSRTGS
jgi:hypothetical protein